MTAILLRSSAPPLSLRSSTSPLPSTPTSSTPLKTTSTTPTSPDPLAHTHTIAYASTWFLQNQTKLNFRSKYLQNQDQSVVLICLICSRITKYDSTLDIRVGVLYYVQ
ncbi:hypothetical protein J5N97_028794 [Dioscorea zingiberensis]|uniref:Uncharacterized protein n=1 Tax=Dioscorea zingiberensis TaxID=325984 RepID=A0A9D5C032_9LILI|nr:hypothetical protein J5N97_028794 [Dioscorea zingiberensis]